MGKFALKFALIILVNLFAFLALGNILDALFSTGSLFLVICLVLSVLSLIVIGAYYVKKTLRELENINKEKNK